MTVKDGVKDETIKMEVIGLIYKLDYEDLMEVNSFLRTRREMLEKKMPRPAGRFF